MEDMPTNNNEDLVSEERAQEMLESGEALSAEEQKRLVFSISDPYTSMAVINVAYENGRVFTDEEKEHLASNMESDPQTVEEFFIHISESGVEMHEMEAWLYKRFGGE